jgi:AhpD family alkylhydroperoxidase
VPHIDLPQLPGIVGLLVQYPQTAGPLNGLADALLRGPSSLSPADRETIAAYVSARNECTFCAETHGAVARHLHAAGAQPGDAQSTGWHSDAVRAERGQRRDHAQAAEPQASHPQAAEPQASHAQAAEPQASHAQAIGPQTSHAQTAGARRVADVIEHGERADVGPKLQALLAIAERVRIDGRSVSAADVAKARAAGADDKAIHDTVLIAAAFCMFNRYVDGLATLALDGPDDYAQHARVLAEGGYLQDRPDTNARP